MALLKTSKVKSVQANGTWEGKFGLMYKFEVEMENGNAGEYSCKTKDQEKFIVGEEVQYEFEDGRFPKIKPYYNKGNFSYTKGGGENPDRQRLIIRQSTLKTAVEYLKGAEASLEEVFIATEKMIEFIMKEDKSKSNENTDDLPF